jgi:hypothetical protein
VAPPVSRPDVTPTALKCQKDSNVVRCESDAGDGHPQEMDVKINRGNVMHNRVCTGSATVFAPSCLQKGTQPCGGVRSSPRTSFNDRTAQEPPQVHWRVRDRPLPAE